MPTEPHGNGFRPPSKKPRIIIPVVVVSLVLVCFTLANLFIFTRTSQTTSETNEPVYMQAVRVYEHSGHLVQSTPRPVISETRNSSRLDNLDDLLDTIDRFIDLIIDMTEDEMARAREIIEEELERARAIVEEELRQAGQEVLQELENVQNHLQNNLDEGSFQWWGNWNPDFSVLEDRVFTNEWVVHEFIDNIADITSVYIVTFDDSVNISTTRSTLTVMYHEWIESQYNISIENGVLTITHNLPSCPITGYNVLRHYLRQNGETSFPHMGIMIPEHLNIEDIHIRSTNAEISTRNLETSANITAISTNGAISIRDSRIGGRTGGNLNMQTTNGAITIWHSILNGIVDMRTTNGAIYANNTIFVRDIVLRTTNGAVNAHNNTFSGNASLRTTNGRVDADENTFHELATLTTTNGNVNTTRNTFNGEARVSTTNGAIRVTRCIFTNLNVSTTRDNINIELPYSAENYDIQFSGRGNIRYNGNRVEARDMRNTNAPRRITASTTGDLIIVSR